MSDDKIITEILITNARNQGAMDSKLDQVHEDLRELKKDYADGRIAAKAAHSDLVNRIDHLSDTKADRIEVEEAIKIGWIIRNWKWIAAILTMLGGVGAITINKMWFVNGDKPSAIEDKTSKRGVR